MASIQVVDDDDALADVVVGYLARAGHAGDPVPTDGEMALRRSPKPPPDLIVLDLMLPEVDGLEVCRRVRADHPELPIIMLTALGEAEDRIAGLEVGADDYVTKPFSPRELVLRIDSVLRRAEPSASRRRPVLQRRADHRRHRARVGPPATAQELSLTVRELDLLDLPDGAPGPGLQPRAS